MKNTRLNFQLKTFFRALFVLVLFVSIPQQVEAQFFKKLVKHAEKKIEREAEKRAERRVDKKIDKSFDAAEDAIDGKKSKKEDSKNNKNSDNQNAQNNPTANNITESQQKSNKPKVVWSKYDFIPGDVVLFEDAPSADEENGEFPSRWDLVGGVCEIGEMDGENVIMFLEGGSASVVPYLKNSKEDYLPEVFTIEMDVYFEPGYHSQRYWIKLRDKKNQSSNGVQGDLTVYVNGMDFLNSSKSYPGTEKYNWGKNPVGGWKHVAIAYTKGKFKAYMDDTRLINVPHLEGNPTGITLTGSGPRDYNLFVKNIRIAKGGVKYYDRVLSEGKIIVNGIKFDINKATLKPESMGPINKIVGLMESNPDLNFSIEGHTDSDGKDDLNKSLSEARAKAVMKKMIAMGINSTRLKSAGWGESKPLDNNGTAEGKANNRRVEFVKFEGSASVSSNAVGSSNSAFDKLDKKIIGEKLEALPDELNIPISNPSGLVNGAGTIILYATSDGNLGKMQILNVDKNDNYKLTVKYATYNYDGSVHSQSKHLEIEGTYTCDLDKGNAKDMIQSEIDFHLGRENKTNTTIYPGETAILRIFN